MANNIVNVKGMQDFFGIEVLKRQKIIQTIISIVQSYGFLPLETSAMEFFKILKGNYGEDENKLLYRVIDSGVKRIEYLSKNDCLSDNFIDKLSKKGLRYDLTIPMLRYVANNLDKIIFPWRRYQIQNVWRADKPQKGRYREFLQFDLDILGAKDFLHEVEILAIGYKCLHSLGINNFIIEINHVELLKSLIVVIGEKDNFKTIFSLIDKTEKIGIDLVIEELKNLGFSENVLKLILEINSFKSNDYKVSLAKIKNKLVEANLELDSYNELLKILSFLKIFGINDSFIRVNFLLARGLSYYSGAIYEFKMTDLQSCTIVAGGRYDNMLFNLFSLKNISHIDSAVGLSFGVDRIYDLLGENNSLFDSLKFKSSLLVCLSYHNIEYAVNIANIFRSKGETIVLYHTDNLKKALSYANRVKFDYVFISGDNERNFGVIIKKDMKTGGQEEIKLDSLI